MEKSKDESDEYKEKVIHDYADKFINLANEMAKSDRSGNVGVAFRFAAARYCAYEASMQTNELAEEKDINKAFRELQMLHKMWKEDVGPVGKEYRDEVWDAVHERLGEDGRQRHLSKGQLGRNVFLCCLSRNTG